ncbi:MAG: HlyD family efflux transporter periplasmic adaptor subunit [Planctomycetota bacterium]
MRLLGKIVIPALACLAAAAGPSPAWGVLIEGFTHPCRTADVAAATSGVVVRVATVEGQRVEAGALLGKLDDAVPQALLQSAKAAAESSSELRYAEAESALAADRLQAIEGLHARGHATPDELRRVRLEADLAAVRVQAAREKAWLRELEVRKLSLQASRCVLRAPFAGVVVTVEKTVGEYVGPIDPVFCRLADTSELSAKFFVPHDTLGGLSSGDTAEVRFPDSGRVVTGSVLVSPLPNGESGTTEVSVTLPNGDGTLDANRRCQLALQRGSDSSGGVPGQAAVSRELRSPFASSPVAGGPMVGGDARRSTSTDGL